MKDSFKIQVAPSKFFRDGRTTMVDNRSDSISYTEFLKYFSGVGEIKLHHLIIGINFVYGWMPTIFHFRSEEFSSALQVLNEAKQGNVPNKVQLEQLKSLFNNSLVGSSKLLHFINPNIFAIWDSRVYRYLTEKEPNNNSIGNCEAYSSYLDFCDKITNMPEYESIHQDIEKKVGYQMTKFRTAELVMYTYGQKNK